MSFTVIINNIPSRELGPVLERMGKLPRGADYDIKFAPELPKPSKKLNGKHPHSRADSLLTMTGKTAKEGSKIEEAVEIFEKLEKRRGIGVVTVKDFREQLEKKELPPTLAQRCVTEKFMAYL